MGPGHSFGDQTPPTGQNHSMAINLGRSRSQTLCFCVRGNVLQVISLFRLVLLPWQKPQAVCNAIFQVKFDTPTCGNHSERPTTREILCLQLPSILVSHTNPWRSCHSGVSSAQTCLETNVSCLGSSPQHHAKIRKLAVPLCTSKFHIVDLDWEDSVGKPRYRMFGKKTSSDCTANPCFHFLPKDARATNTTC